jgi:hypothetical protein
LHTHLFWIRFGRNPLANDPEVLQKTSSPKKPAVQGKAKVNAGISVFIVVPQDINYQFGNGRISLYAEDGKQDGNGIYTNIIIGGTGNGINDNEGPEIKAYLNDEKFVNGSITNNKPVLLLKLYDSSGINIMGTGIGHELEAVLDNDPDQKFILNDFYDAETDNFRKGTVRFQLPEIKEGTHQLVIRPGMLLTIQMRRA